MMHYSENHKYNPKNFVDISIMSRSNLDSFISKNGVNSTQPLIESQKTIDLGNRKQSNSLKFGHQSD